MYSVESFPTKHVEIPFCPQSKAKPGLSLHLANFYFSPQDPEITYSKYDAVSGKGQPSPGGDYSVPVYILLCKLQQGSWSAWRSGNFKSNLKCSPDSFLF